MKERLVELQDRRINSYLAHQLQKNGLVSAIYALLITKAHGAFPARVPWFTAGGAGRMLVSSMCSYPIVNGSSILPPATMMLAYPTLLNLKDELTICTGLSHSGRLHLPV